MSQSEKIRVLVVDDSLLSREFIIRGLEADPQLEVVAKASNPFEARDKIIEFRPDVMTCDINMPKMDGIEFIRRLLPQYPIPVVVVSSVSGAIFDALNAGAVEFVAKPDEHEDPDLFIKRLIQKIKIASKAKLTINPGQPDNKLAMSREAKHIDIIAIGASTGGTEALHYLLKTLPPTIPGIVIVQHIPPVFSRLFAERLNNQTAFTVKEAQTGDVVEKGKVFIAPGQQNMRVKKQGNRYVIVCAADQKISGHMPSVDVLFESVAVAAKEKAIGVILTGMGYDGAKGLLAMRRKGARTIGQDEASSVVYGMPKAAFEIGAVEKQVGLQQIPRTLLNMLK